MVTVVLVLLYRAAASYRVTNYKLQQVEKLVCHKTFLRLLSRTMTIITSCSPCIGGAVVHLLDKTVTGECGCTEPLTSPQIC